MRDVKFIVIHEAACPRHKKDGSDFTITDIDQWHDERGFKRSAFWRSRFNPDLKACGYHYVVGVGGEVWLGRHENEIPAAVKGFNSVSVNICLIGQNGDFTEAQWNILPMLLGKLQDKYENAQIVGHNNVRFNSGKTCPGFDVKAYVKNGMKHAG